MVASAVLSLGMVAIFQALFISLQGFSYCSDYLNLAPQIQEKVWQAQDSLYRQGQEAAIETQGTFLAAGKQFPWSLSYVIVDAENELYKIDLVAAWKTGRRNAQISRTAYALYANNSTSEE